MNKYMLIVIIILMFSVSSCSGKNNEFRNSINSPEIISIIIDNDEINIDSTISSGNVLFNWFTVNDILKNIIFSYIDKEKIYSTTPGSWGTKDNDRNLDSIRIRILFNKGYWNDMTIYNEMIENEILNLTFITFSNLNENKDILKLENMEIASFFPFKIISPNELRLSKDEKENLESLLYDEFGIEHVLTINKNYCEGYIHYKTDFNRFLSFMKMIFGNNIIIEM